MIKGNGISAIKVDLDWIKEKQKEHSDKIDTLMERIEKFPCEAHTEQLKTIFGNLSKGERQSDNKIYWAIGITGVIVTIINFVVSIA